MTRVVGDIGGTNARFGIVSPGKPEPRRVRVLRFSEHPSFEGLIAHYMQESGLDAISELALAVAMPSDGDLLQMTNNGWSFSRSGLIRTYNLDRLLITNDFSALAVSIPVLAAADVQPIGTGQFLTRSAIGVIGPGTGLGVSGLLPAANNQWSVIRGEGGHVDLVPRSDREALVLQQMQSHYGRVSAERVLSGPGLCAVYAALCSIDGVPVDAMTAAEITDAAAQESNPRCTETLQLFCAQLGAVAGNLALTLGAKGGIYIGGGIVPRLGQNFDQQLFRQAFEDKGRMTGYVAGIGTRLVVAEFPALIGAAEMLDQPAAAA